MALGTDNLGCGDGGSEVQPFTQTSWVTGSGQGVDLWYSESKASASSLLSSCVPPGSVHVF